MTALEMLEKLQKEWEFQAKDQGIVTEYRLYACAYELKAVIDKLREEQQDNHLDTILTMFRAVGSIGEHWYSRREIEEYVEALIERAEHVKEQNGQQ